MHRSGYIELLTRNRNFRRLFVGQIISQAGDWFNTVAIFTLLLSLTGSGQSVAFVLILKLLPTFSFGPLAALAWWIHIRGLSNSEPGPLGEAGVSADPVAASSEISPRHSVGIDRPVLRPEGGKDRIRRL